MDSKSRMGTKVQTLIRDLEKLKIAKEALKMNIKTRNAMRDITEPAELHEVVKSKRKINKKGEYRMGGKVKKLSSRQMDMYKKNYGKGAIARSLIKTYQQSNPVGDPDSTFQNNMLPPVLNQNYTDFSGQPDPEQTNQGGTYDPNPILLSPLLNFPGSNNQTNTEAPIDNRGFTDAERARGRRNVPLNIVEKSGKKKPGYNKDVTSFRLMPDGTIVPSTGTWVEPVLSYEKDKGGNPIIKTMKGIEKFDVASGDIKFTNDASGRKAEEIWNNSGDDASQFLLNYLKAANNEMALAGKKIEWNELYNYIKQHPQLDKIIKAGGGYDKKYGKQHEKAIALIDKDNFTLWDEQGQSDNWPAIQEEAIEEEIALPEEGEEEIAEEVIDEGGEEEVITDEEIPEDDENIFGGLQDVNSKMTSGEKIGLATGAAGRLGGIAAALSNKPQNATNAFSGIGNRADEHLREQLKTSRSGIEQTAAQIKAQGNLARKVARDTSNSWAQRYAASLGAQRLTDEGLIKNRNMWERLYGDIKGKQAQLALRGDMADAQGAMQVQDWYQRDKDSYLTGLAQEGQNLTNYGASISQGANMKKFRDQQLAALRDMGSYFKFLENDEGTMNLFLESKWEAYKKKKEKEAKKKTGP